jgi:AcrR family transcriptional regulator
VDLKLSESRAGGSGQAREPKRQRREKVDAQAREQILEAMLGACGELGYRAVTVKDVYERYGGYRVEFYNHFASKAECYAVAYELGIERLWRRLMRACEAAGDWASGLQAALGELAAFVSERSDIAAGLLVQARVAGGPAGAKRAEVLERLTCAVDGARRETSASRHSPPPITARFMVSAIEESVVSALARGVPEDFAAAVPSLAGLGVTFYFSGEAGRGKQEREGDC